MQEIHIIESYGKRLLCLQKYHDSIAAEIGRSDGKTKCQTDNFYFSKDEDFSLYAPSALEAMCTGLDKEMNELTLKIQKRHDAVLEHMPETQYQAMWQSHVTKLPEEIEAEEAKARIKKRNWKGQATSAEIMMSAIVETERKKILTFPEAVTEHGEHSYALWQCHRHFDETVMCFLLLHPDYTERLASNRENVSCALELGLCAASSRYCVLRIKEVPCMAEWEVGEYDGNESIFLR